MVDNDSIHKLTDNIRSGIVIRGEKESPIPEEEVDLEGDPNEILYVKDFIIDEGLPGKPNVYRIEEPYVKPFKIKRSEYLLYLKLRKLFTTQSLYPIDKDNSPYRNPYKNHFAPLKKIIYRYSLFRWLFGFEYFMLGKSNKEYYGFEGEVSSTNMCCIKDHYIREVILNDIATPNTVWPLRIFPDGISGRDGIRYEPQKEKMVTILKKMEKLDSLLLREAEGVEEEQRLPDNISELKNLVQLAIISWGLKRLPRSFGRLKNLRSLFLVDNWFTYIPKSIFRIKKLQHLILEENNINEIPPDILKLENLITLDLSGNPLGAVPEHICELPNLRYFRFDQLYNNIWVKSYNQTKYMLSSLPDCFHKLQKLETLILSNNKFQTIPECIKHLHNLKSLIMYYNSVTSIPSFIYDMKNLEVLSLTCNKIDEISPEIEKMQNLKILELGGNNLQEIPPEIGNLKDLRVLKLGGNNLTSLPKTINKLSNIGIMNVRGNNDLKVNIEEYSVTIKNRLQWDKWKNNQNN